MAEKFISLLMASRTQAHMFHLTTKSFAEHKALQAYYEGIVPLVDAWAEAYIGKYGPIKRAKMGTPSNASAKVAFQTLLKRIRALRLPRDTYLKNIQDEIIALIRSTVYMLSLR